MSTTHRRIAPGVYEDQYGIRARAQVRRERREKRFERGTPLRTIQEWQEDMRTYLRAHTPKEPRGTLRRDARKYFKRIAHLAGYKARVCEINAWVALYGNQSRNALKKDHVSKARQIWLDDGYRPHTINNRVGALRHLYHELDGHSCPTPCDEIEMLDPDRKPPTFVHPNVIRSVARSLADEPVSQARFLMITAFGARPSEIMRAQRADVNLEKGFCFIRTGKGGAIRFFWLNDDMKAAWKAFIAVGAWGKFDVSDYDKDLYAAGWPKGVRPYSARATFGMELSERGVDLADIQVMLGHARIETTRQMYVPPRQSRLGKASQKMGGRLGWQDLVKGLKRRIKSAPASGPRKVASGS